MVLFFGCIVLGGCLTFLGEFFSEGRKRSSVLGNVAWATLTGMGGALFGAIIGLMLCMCIGTFSSRETVSIKYDKVALVALKGGDRIHGSFFLGSGNIDGQQCYEFYFKTPDGGEKFGTVPAKDTTVYEEDRQDAFMYQVGKRDKYSDRVHFWLVPRFLLSKAYDDQYVIHVPKGTIKVGYNLDLK